jgi:hypothetical protein
LKPLAHCRLNFITCEINSSEMFLERVLNNIKSTVLCHQWSGNTSVESGIIMLSMRWLFPPQMWLTCYFNPLQGQHVKSWSWYSYFSPCTPGECCLHCPRNDKHAFFPLMVVLNFFFLTEVGW